MKVALYCRVSTQDQNCDLQLRELREYCARRGWDLTAEYVDTGWSGAKASRPQLDRLMQDARRRRFDVVLVWKLDRWAAAWRTWSRAFQELSGLGVRFIAIAQNIDTDESNPMARLLMHLMGAFAEFEREMIRDRTVSGVRAAKAKGKTLGRPRRVFRRDEVISMRAAGSSWSSIARTLGVPVSTARGALAEMGCLRISHQRPQKQSRNQRPQWLAEMEGFSQRDRRDQRTSNTTNIETDNAAPAGRSTRNR